MLGRKKYVIFPLKISLRIHLEVKQETYFLQHLLIQEMCLIDDNDRLQPMNATHWWRNY
jgi:hypothetical protein